MKAKNACGQYLFQKASFLSELSVMDISFKSMPPSYIAFGALLNVLDEIDDELISKSDQIAFAKKVGECLKIRIQRNSSLHVGRKLMIARMMLARLTRRSTFLVENGRRSIHALYVNKSHDKESQSVVDIENDEDKENQPLGVGTAKDRRDDTDTPRSTCYSP